MNKVFSEKFMMNESFDAAAFFDAVAAEEHDFIFTKFRSKS